MGVLDNKIRFGNFSSSDIYKLLESKTVRSTYIKEKNIERKMGLHLGVEVYSHPMSWGNTIEAFIFQNDAYFDTSYKSCGDVTLPHPTIGCWVGSPDYTSESKKIIAECKGYQRKQFALYADAIATESCEVLKKDFPQEYWQLVSNAIILGYDHIQPVLFMPYFSELFKLKEFIDNEWDTDEPFKYKWISDTIGGGNYNQLSYLPDGGYYKNFNTCVLEVPKEDKEELIEAVLKAGNELTDFHKPRN